MVLHRLYSIAALCAFVSVPAAVLAEELGSLSTGGAGQVTKWCSNGINTYSDIPPSSCPDSLPELLLGPRTAFPTPTPSDPGGNVELGYSPSGPPAPLDWVNATTLSGTFAAGDAITLSGLTEADWTPAFCEQWIADITSGNGVNLTPFQVTTICTSLLADPGPPTKRLLRQASNPNISYVSKNGSVRIGTATLFNASLALKGIAAAAPGVDPDDVPDVVRFSEPVKITYQGKTSIRYCAGVDSIVQTGQWANDTSCPFNQNAAQALQFCSHSGTCEITIPVAPPPVAVPAISALGLAGSAAGLLAIGLAGLRRRRSG